MVNHLGKVHDIHPKSQGEAIAMKWKYTVEKQAWSCGFCGEVFVTFNDRLNHITTQHFESGHTIAGWHATNVIQGLLKQPGMVEAWKEKVASLPTWEVNDMVWESDAIIELQHDLEVGPNTARSAVDLAKAAYVACRMNRGMEYQRAMTAPESKSDKTLVATPFSPNHSQTPLASAPNFLSNHHQTRSAIQELDETSPRGLAIQVMPLKSNNYSSTPTPDLSNSNNVGSALSTFCPATRDQGNYTNSQHGGNGNDKEEDEIWPRTPGSVYETEFDTVFNIDDRRA